MNGFSIRQEESHCLHSLANELVQKISVNSPEFEYTLKGKSKMTIAP